MPTDLKHCFRRTILVLLCTVIAFVADAQSKSGTKPVQKKPAPTVKPAPKQDKPQGSSIPAEQMETYRQQAGQIVKFYESTLNFLASKSNPVKEKEVIINESYLKFFWNDKVQIEDDLDDHRLVPLYKDVQAYLSDVDFFFKRARFTYLLQNVDVKTNIDQQTYFFVTVNRNLAGLTVNGDSVNSNKVRYFEINYDDSKQELKIVSIYTTKLNEKDELRNWWNGLTDEWRGLLGKDLMVQEGLPLSAVSHYNDTVAIVEGMPVKLYDSRIYGLFLKIVDSKELNLSGNASLTDLTPLSRLSALVTLDISGTAVTDLMPLRNLNSLEVLKCSTTVVSSMEPLKYCSHIRELNLSGTSLTDLSTVSGFSGLESLDISRTGVSTLEPLKEMSSLKELRLAGTAVRDMTPISGLTALTLLDISSTPVSDLAPLKSLPSLQKLWMDKTQVASLSPINGLPALQSVYCDDTRVGKQNAVNYMLAHPGVVVIFATAELTAWWNAMPQEWKKVISYYRTMDKMPSKEQLHSLMTVDSLNIEGRTSLASLEPVSQFPRLATLICSNSSISDLSPLKDLTLLTCLDLRNTLVASLEPLRNQNNLKTLLIDNTRVNDLSPVAGLPSLALVQADNTGVSLEQGNAFIDRNPACRFVFQTFENESWWKGLNASWQKALLKETGQTGEPDKFGLQAIAGTERLVIEQDPMITDLQPVLYLSRLKEFRFSDTRVTTLDPLRRMTRLIKLGFPKNPIFDLTPVGGLTQLQELDFENTQVEDLQPIAGLLNLEVLKMSGTPVKTLKYISAMRKLQDIDLYNTKISNIDILDQLPQLRSVRIFNTKISPKKVDAFKLKHPECKVDYY